MTEQTRRENNRDRILAHLRKVGRAKNHELVQIGGMRAMGRVHELKQTHVIDVVHLSGGEWEIVYRGLKSSQPVAQGSFLEQMEAR